MTLVQFFYFMCGQLGVMLLSRFFFQWILHFSSQPSASDASILLFSPILVGGVLLGFRIFDALTDPLAGMLSDAWVRKGRERRTFVSFWFLLPSIGLVLCFLPSFEFSPMLRWGLLILGMTLFFVGYTFYAIPYWSLVDDYAVGDEVRRGRLSNLLGAGLMLATAIGFIVTPLLIHQLGYQGAVLLVAVAGSVLMLLPYLASPSDFVAKVPSAQESSEVGANALRFADVLEAIRHRQFFALCILYVGSQMSLTIMTSAAPFVAIQLLGGTEADVALLMGPLLGFAILSFILVPRISRRFGWERSSVYASLVLAAVYGFGLCIGEPIIGSAFTTAAVIFALAGPFIAVLLGVEAEAIADCAGQRGKDKVSCYFGVFNLIVKAGNGLAIFIAGILIHLSTTSLGNFAIKLMLVAAGLALVIGVGSYFALSRHAKRMEPASNR